MQALRIILLTAFATIFFASCAPPQMRTSQPQQNNNIPNSQLANPAAEYCLKQGYSYETRKDAQGNEHGVCIFDDGSECDAWAYFRGECGQDKAKNLSLNLVEAAGLDQTISIDILAHKTSSVDPDVTRHPSKPGMEVIVTISDPETVQSLVAPLDATLPLVPPMRCPALYELQFHLQSGETQSFRLGICGLHGDQPFFKEMTVRLPDEFIVTFNALLKQALPAKK